MEVRYRKGSRTEVWQGKRAVLLSWREIVISDQPYTRKACVTLILFVAHYFHPLLPPRPFHNILQAEYTLFFRKKKAHTACVETIRWMKEVKAISFQGNSGLEHAVFISKKKFIASLSMLCYTCHLAEASFSALCNGYHDITLYAN